MYKRQELDSIVEKSNKKNNEQVDKIRGIVNKNLEMLNETSTFETVDSYLPFFYKEMESFFDYLEGYTSVSYTHLDVYKRQRKLCLFDRYNV